MSTRNQLLYFAKFCVGFPPPPPPSPAEKNDKKDIQQKGFLAISGQDIGLVASLTLETETESRSINTQKKTWPISSQLGLTIGQ